MKWHKEQRGFTLLELLITLSIAALIFAACTMAIIQVIRSTEASDSMVAIRQVQTAGFWVSKDALQAQNITATDMLTLKWTDFNDRYHIVVYTLEDMPSGDLKQLKREETINDGSPINSSIAQYLDPENTCWVWNETTKGLTFKVTAEVGGKVETRIYEITPRPLS